MLDLESLRCFQAAALRLNFRAASRAVGLSPAAFSDRIQRLEDQLGARLFIRSTRRVVLSPEGERLLPQARKVLSEAYRCLTMVGTREPVPFELSIGTRWELGMSWVLPAIEALEDLNPTRRVNLAFGNGTPLLESLLRGQIDAVIGSMRITKNKLAYVPLHEEQYRFVATPKTLAQHPLQSAKDARNHTLVDISDSYVLFRYWLDQAPSAHEWVFGKQRFLGTIGAIYHWVIHHRGVAVLPAYYVAPDLESGRLVEVLADVRPSKDWFRLVWVHGHPRDMELRELGAQLAERPLQ